MTWSRTNNFYRLALTLLMLCLGLTLVQGWNDDEEILKWSPNWLSNLKYSTPIGIRNRGYAYRKRNAESLLGYKRLPNFPPPPFETKRSPGLTRERVLGWYSGPGSVYHLDNSREDFDSEFEAK